MNTTYIILGTAGLGITLISLCVQVANYTITTRMQRDMSNLKAEIKDWAYATFVPREVADARENRRDNNNTRLRRENG